MGCDDQSLSNQGLTILDLGSQLRKGLAKVRAMSEAQKSHFLFSGVWENVREWTSTFPSKLPLWELESRQTSKFSESDYKGQNHWIEEFFISLKSSWNIDV